MASKTHGQACPIAAALDRVGDRWTLLILRDLTLGPLRFSELLDLEDGIGPNLLTQRLKSLQAAGYVYSAPLPFPARSHAYALTALGQSVRPLLDALQGFGERCARPERARNHPDWLIRALPGRFGGTERTGRIGISAPDRAYTLDLHRDGLEVTRRFADGCRAQVAFGAGGVLDWLQGASLAELEASGRAIATGDRSLLDGLADAVGLRR